MHNHKRSQSTRGNVRPRGGGYRGRGRGRGGYASRYDGYFASNANTVPITVRVQGMPNVTHFGEWINVVISNCCGARWIKTYQKNDEWYIICADNTNANKFINGLNGYNHIGNVLTACIVGNINAHRYGNNSSKYNNNNSDEKRQSVSNNNGGIRRKTSNMREKCLFGPKCDKVKIGQCNYSHPVCKNGIGCPRLLSRSCMFYHPKEDFDKTKEDATNVKKPVFKGI